MKSISLHLQTFILLGLVSGIVTVTALFAGFNYLELYNSIQAGFDRKLFAASTTTAAFIDGEAHENLLRLKNIEGLVYSEATHRFYGLEADPLRLLTIDSVEGSAEELFSLKRADLKGLSGSALPNILYTLSSANEHSGTKLVSFNTDTLEIAERGEIREKLEVVKTKSKKQVSAASAPLGDQLNAIAYRADGNLLYALGQNLWEIELATLHAKKIGVPKHQGLSGLVWNGKKKLLYAIQATTGLVVTIDPGSADSQELGLLDQPAPQQGVDTKTADNQKNASLLDDTGAVENAEQWVEPEVIVLPARALAYDAENDLLYASTDRLVKVDSTTGRGEPQGFRRGFRSENDRTYVKAVLPMQRVLRDNELTYHYTAIPFDQTKIRYVVDSTVGAAHSKLATEEDNPAEEAARLQEVMNSAQASISPIQHFDIWGLLKIGTAPITDVSGKARGLVGADVNVSVIEKKTRLVLFESMGLGAAVVVLSVMLSVFIARRLVAPVHALRQSALKMGAGMYEQQIVESGPRELSQVAGALEQVRAQLWKESAEERVQQEQFEKERRSSVLIRQMQADRPRRFDRGADFCSTTAGHLLWTYRGGGDVLERARIAQDIGRLSERLQEQGERSAEDLMSVLRQLYRQEITLFLLIDREGNRLISEVREPSEVFVVAPEGRTQILTLTEGQSINVKTGSIAVLGSDGQVVAEGAVRNCLKERKNEGVAVATDLGSWAAQLPGVSAIFEM